MEFKSKSVESEGGGCGAEMQICIQCAFTKIALTSGAHFRPQALYRGWVKRPHWRLPSPASVGYSPPKWKFLAPLLAKRKSFVISWAVWVWNAFTDSQPTVSTNWQCFCNCLSCPVQLRPSLSSTCFTDMTLLKTRTTTACNKLLKLLKMSARLHIRYASNHTHTTWCLC